MADRDVQHFSPTRAYLACARSCALDREEARLHGERGAQLAHQLVRGRHGPVRPREEGLAGRRSLPPLHGRPVLGRRPAARVTTVGDAVRSERELMKGS